MAEAEQRAADGRAPVWRSCGAHRFYVRDDVLFWEGHGPMQLADIECLFAKRMQLQLRHDQVFVVVDCREVDGVPPETRRYAAQLKPEVPFQGTVVVFGAGLIVRTLISLIVGAARLLGRTDTRHMFFVDDAHAAWAIVERERQALRDQLPTT